MTFLNPLLLLGLAAAAIPLIIHLFNFRRPKRIEFSSLAFLHELKKSTMQRVRIKQWLLLLLRTLAIVFLVLSFARPTMTGDLVGAIGVRGRVSTALILDNSESMLLRDGSGSYLEQARTIAAGLIEEMQTGDEMYLIPGIPSNSEPTAFLNKASARQALMSIEAMEGQMVLSRTAWQAAAVLAGSAHPNREAYVLSDLQESTFTDSIQASGQNTVMAPSRNAEQNDISFYLVPIGTRSHDNVAISQVDVLSRMLSQGEVIRMEATLVNYGERPVPDAVVSLYLEGDRVSRATTSLAPGEITRVPIAVTPRSTGWLAGHVEIEDIDFRSDDVRRFTIFVPDERRILVVGGAQSNTTYLELALSDQVTEGRVRFDVERIAETELAQTNLGTFDAVVLSGVSDFSSGELAALVAYVRDGGGLLIFPGDSMNLTDYNALFEELGGGQIAEITEELAETSSVGGFQQIDVEHSVFEGMFESGISPGAARLEQPEIRRLLKYLPSTGSEETLIRLTGDWSFLQEIHYELGSVHLFTVSPDISWSDFPVRGLFIPLLYRSVYYLSAAGSVAGEEFVAGASAEIRLTGVPNVASITVTSDDGDSYQPEVRRLPGSHLVLIQSGYLKTGIYNVHADGNVVRRFVVHPVSGESNLQTLGAAEASRRLAEAVREDVDVLDLAINNPEDLIARLAAVRTGVELWNVFLALALVTLLAEMLVQKKWRPEAA